MKPIQPVNIWVNGEQKQANNISLYIVNDNLINSATFYYALVALSEDEENPSSVQCAQGNLTMSGTDYETWGDSGDINTEAYIWAAAQLNLILV